MDEKKREKSLSSNAQASGSQLANGWPSSVQFLSLEGSSWEQSADVLCYARFPVGDSWKTDSSTWRSKLAPVACSTPKSSADVSSLVRVQVA